MIDELNCKVINDLLPSYLDDITNETSNIEVKKHLDKCEMCKKKYLELKKDRAEFNKDIFFIKDTKKKVMNLIIFSLSLGIILAAIYIFCSCKDLSVNGEISNIIFVIFIAIGRYIMPLFAIDILILWRSILDNKKIIFFQEVLILFFLISTIIDTLLLMWRIF